MSDKIIPHGGSRVPTLVMAQLNLRPPEPFDFRNPDDWPRFEQYRVAAGLTADSEGKQVNTLLYCLGEEAEAVLNSTNASADDKAKYDLRSSTSMALYDLAENCEYGNMKSEMLRDRLVVGICDQSLSEKLQMDSDLTLEKAKKQIRQREAVHEQQQELKGDEPSSADAVK